MTRRLLHARATRAQRERERERETNARFVRSLENNAASGFTLFELLLYVGIFAIAAGLLTGILTTLTRVQVRENASVEVSGQAQFVIQRLQQLIRDASIVELPANQATSTLKLRTTDPASDPTCVQLSGGVVYVMQGNDGVNKQNCFATSSPQAAPLTDAKVIVNSLAFTKFSNPPAKDTTQINLTLSYNSTNPQESLISRTLETAITKVSAAVFDSDIIPAADNVYNVGLGAQRWVNGYFANNLLVGYTSMTGGVAAFNGSLGVGTNAPAASALVDLSSTAKGFLPPRMTTAQRDGIASPATGLLIYNATSNEYNLYNGTSWGAVGVGWAASSTDIYNTNSGNVGIGTTNPLNKLDVSGAAAIGTYAGVNTGPSNGLIVSGNVGIGTASPTVTAGTPPGSQTFTSSGTFTVPTGVTSVKVTLAGGGAGGGGGQRRAASSPGCGCGGGGGGGGGGGQYLQDQVVSVTPGQNITVTVGSGGAGGTGGGSADQIAPSGSAGESSSFGSLVTAAGGSGGNGANSTTGGAGGGAGGAGGTAGSSGGSGPGGSGGAGGNSQGTGGAGVGGDTLGNAGGNYGGGGSGGGGGSTGNNGQAGGNGAPGYLLVEWSGSAPGTTPFLDIKGTTPGLVLHASNTGDTAKQFGITNTASGVFIDSAGAATATNNAIIFRVSGTDAALTYTERMRIQSNGNVGIGTTNPATALDVNGTITGTTKNFAIPDPMKPGYTLVHSTLEGPEIAVFYRGEAQLVHGRATVKLPDYFEALTRKEGRTVLLTPEYASDNEPISALAASAVTHGTFTVRAADDKHPNETFFWEVKATRADQPTLDVEVPTR